MLVVGCSRGPPGRLSGAMVAVMALGFDTGEMIADRFEVIRELGSGGWGTVYLTKDRISLSLVAVKLLWPNRMRDEVMRSRFLREVEIGRTIVHPNIATFLDAGFAGEIPWIAMEYVDGGTLESHVKVHGRFRADRAADLLRKVCAGVGAAHIRSVIHCDVTYRNVLVPRDDTDRPEPKIIDFGIAKVLNVRTGTTQLVGTKLFMAPEQHATRQVVPATDVWSIGLLGFFLLVGRDYWRDEDSPERNHPPRITDSASRRAAQLAPDVHLPPGFDRWFAKCTMYASSERFADANAAGEAIMNWSADPVATTVRTPAPVRKMGSLWIGAIVVTVVVVSVAMLRRPSAPSPWAERGQSGTVVAVASVPKEAPRPAGLVASRSAESATGGLGGRVVPSDSPLDPRYRRIERWLSQATGVHRDGYRARPLREGEAGLSGMQVSVGTFVCTLQFDDIGDPMRVVDCDGRGSERTAVPITLPLECSRRRGKGETNCGSGPYTFEDASGTRGVGRFYLTLRE